MPDRTERDRLKASPDAAGQPPAPDTRAVEPARRKGERARGDRAASLGESLHDALTGAHSRASLHDRLRQEVERARRYALPLSLLVVDLDHFKSINDAFGHTRGDQVLVSFVERTRSLMRDSDLLFRYGGDEFVLLLPHTDQSQAPAFGRRLIEGMRAAPLPGSPPLSVTLSIGSASFPADGPAAEDLFESADRRLLDAKHQGRNRVVAEDAVRPGRLTFEMDSRPLERELPLTTLRHFLDSLPEQKRGLFSIGGPRGVGKSWFLADVAKAARLRGYAVWSVRGRPALRQRVYGALAEAPPPFEPLPPPAAGEGAFIQALQDSLVEQGQAGLFVAVDRLAHLDRATLDLLRQVLLAPQIRIAGLAYTVDPDTLNRPAFFEVPLQVDVALQALTATGVRLWLRTVLRWEPTAAFSDWLHDETGGRPGLLGAALRLLVERGALQPLADSWVLAPDFTGVRLQAELERLVAAPTPNLPAVATGFVGRDDEVRDLKRLLQQEALVVLVGPGGIGKTRLAIQASAEVAEQFGDGVHFASLEGANTLEAAIAAAAQAVGLALTGAEEPRARLLRHLADTTLLLVLDDCGPLLEAAGLVLDLTRQAPHVKLLITSRERLNLPGETTVELRGLPVPPLRTAEERSVLLPASAYSAEQLFVQSARRSAPDFALSDDDRLYVRRICQLVDGLPLGIELAAAWTPLLTCREIAGQIERNFDFLVTQRAEVPERQRSARAVLDYFWGLLSDDERERLGGLAVFRGGLERDAARRVAGASLFFLSALVDKAFLRKAPSGRYEMQELLRQYAQAKLAERPEQWQRSSDRHCDYFAEFISRLGASLKSGRQAEALAAIQGEIGNVRAAWQWAATQGRAEAISRLAEGLVLFHEAQNAYHEGAEVFGRALEQWPLRSERAAGPSSLAAAWLLAGRAAFAHRLGDNQAAREGLEASLRLLRQPAVEPHEQTATSFALYYLGRAAADLGDYAEGQQRLRAALALRRGAGDRHGTARTLQGLAALLHAQGDYREARRLLGESLELQRAIGDERGASITLCQVARVLFDLGEYAEAQARLGESATLAEAHHWQGARLHSLRILARLAAQRGEPAEARQFYAESLAAHRASGDQKEIALDLLGLADAAVLSGLSGEALALCEESLATCRRSGYTHGAALALAALGEVALVDLDDAAGQAERHFGEALNLAWTIGALPTALAAVVGLAALRRQTEATLAIELLTFVLYHPASSRRTLDRAGRMLSSLESAGDGQSVALAEERGRGQKFHELVRRLSETDHSGETPHAD